MLRRQHFYRQLFGLTTTILLANCLAPLNVVGQTSAADSAGGCSAYASVPLPAEAEKAPVPKTFPACASYRSYRGIGRPINYAEARACAWQERLAQQAGLEQNQKEPTSWFVGGSLILADIYFNGAGVKRDVPLAMRFACESDVAELALPDIAKLNGASPANGPFEFCDYGATTITMSFCSGYESKIEDDRRTRYYDSLKSSMTSDQKAAFEKLLAAQRAYVDAHGAEVYQGGTIHAIRNIGSANILKNLFHTEVVHFESKKWPAISNDRIATADALVNREYANKLQLLRKRTKEEIEDGAVTANGLASAQRAWETYRDAWVAFARVRYPDAADAIRGQITLDRYRLLRTIS